jgi:hypothetical protein
MTQTGMHHIGLALNGILERTTMDFAIMQKGEPMANIILPIQVVLPDDWVEQIVNRLRNDPEAEWVEVTRCKDCKHRGEKPIADGRYWCDIHDTFMYYCSDAERRTDELGDS